MKPFVIVENLSKRYGSLTVFEEVNLSIERGEFVCIIGHSGCGKSTILNILAGLDEPSEGYVFVDQRQVLRPGLDRGVIFQNHNLLPWKSALENVMFSVRARFPHWTRAEVRAHSLKYLELVGLANALDRKPAQLSGGMRQRVGIARAFALEPKLLLMDEPFGALDALTRGLIQDELIRTWSRSGQTVVMITHDVDEALYLSDRVLLMTAGPCARIAESVAVDFARPRERSAILHDPRYYALRNHMIEFLLQNGPGAPSQRSASAPARETNVPALSEGTHLVHATERIEP
jgi:nitrate/nitrite transport system ATP-binding protein